MLLGHVYQKDRIPAQTGDRQFTHMMIQMQRARTKVLTQSQSSRVHNGITPTRGDNTTQSSAPEDGHMVTRNMLSNLKVRHPRCVGSITKNFVFYAYSNTTIFYLLVQ